MKPFLPLVVALLSSQTARAERIYCFFTEPFFNLTYNSDTNKLTHSSPGSADKEGVAKVIFNKNGTILLTVIGVQGSLLVDTTKTGSDGMSDYIYPFEGIVNGNLYGGCETDHLKKKLSTKIGHSILK
ncbi:hypothetical protein ACLVWU_00305 [Bdellovibrio sp. HCB290]|uniref:hypothetical protein n=1 Tax=Bdellovibrio sp. HCB290 TaxID=3394356 RepID=UPI0039B55A41